MAAVGAKGRGWDQALRWLQTCEPRLEAAAREDMIAAAGDAVTAIKARIAALDLIDTRAYYNSWGVFGPGRIGPGRPGARHPSGIPMGRLAAILEAKEPHIMDGLAQGNRSLRRRLRRRGLKVR